MKADCIKDNLELLTYIRSSKNISEAKKILDTICGESRGINLIPKEE